MYLQPLRIANNFVSNSKNEELFPDAYKEVFDNRKINHYQDSNDQNNSQYYINSPTKETTNEKVKNEGIKIAKITFIIKKQPQKKLLGFKKSRGRQKNKNEISNKNSQRKHDKNSLDNILNKLQVDSINCLRKCINHLKYSCDHNIKEKFLDINAGFKKNVTKENLNKMKKRKLYEILTENISQKYQNYSEDYNKKLYNQMEKDKNYISIINLLNKDYLYFFRNMYFKKEKTVNFHQYGIEESISLSKKVDLYNGKNQFFNDKDVKYKKCILKCINENYFDGKLMFPLEEIN